MQKINARNITLAILLLLILVVIALFIGKFTYSYLAPDLGDDLTTDGEVTASGDILIFSKGNNLSLFATTDNFNATSGNLTSTTNPSVRLISSSRTNDASATYYAGIKINENTFSYSTTAKTAEIILTVKDENGSLVTSSSDSLPYVTVNGISGFDITESTGTYYIASNYTIQTSTEIMQNWETTITFVNLEESQNVNLDKNLSGYIKLEKAE